MHELADDLAGPLVTSDEARARELEARAADSATLAFRVAFSVLRHRQDAEDAAQDAFVRACRRFADLRDRDRFRAWLVRMTWRLALDRRRADGRRVAREQAARAPLAVPPDAEAGVLAGEQSARLWRAVDALPEKLRLAVVLSAIEGHDVAAVARLLGVPPGTVKSRLFEARRRLKEQLS